SIDRPAIASDGDDDEACSQDRPRCATTEVATRDGEPLDGGTDQRGLALCNYTESRRERTIAGVGIGDSRRVRRGSEHVEPPRFMRAAQALDRDVRIRASKVRTDLGAVVFDGTVSGVDAALERVPIDVHEARRG